MATTSLTPEQEIPLRLRLWLEAASVFRFLTITIWVSTWYQVLLGFRTGWLPTFLFLTSIALFSFYLTRVLGRLQVGSFVSRIIFAIWLLLSIIISLQVMVFARMGNPLGSLANESIQALYASNPDIGIFIHILFVLLVAWRGLALAQSSMDVGESSRSFQVGIAMFLVFGLMFGANQPASFYLPVYAFLVVGLIAMAIARITDLSFMRGGRLPSSFHTWLLPILGSAGIVVAFAILFGWLTSQQVGALSVAILAILFIVIFLLSIVVAAPFLLVIYLIMPWLQRMFGEGLKLLPIQDPGEIADDIFGKELEEIAKSTTGIDQGYIIILGIILLAVIAFVLVSLRWKPFNRQIARGTDEMESVRPSPFLLWRQEGEPGFLRPFGKAGRLLAAARIRRVYAQLMDLTAKLGTPRPAALTPLEFLPQLNRVFPTREGELKAITQAYLKIRYGELPENDEEVQEVIRAWELIQQDGTQALKAIAAAKKKNQKQAAKR